MTKKALYSMLVCGLLLTGCASTSDDTSTQATTNSTASSADSSMSAADCEAKGQKSYEMASGSVICY